MNKNLEKFKQIAKLSGIDVFYFYEVRKTFDKLGYKNEDYFSKNGIGIIKAIAANSEEANVLVDVSTEDKLSTAIDNNTLFLIVYENRIFKNMYETYKKTNSKYAIFIGGESKTADIEKQLISGIQGAKKVIFVIK